MPMKDEFEQVAKEKGLQLAHAIESSARSTFPILNSYDGNRLPGSQYSVVRHCRSCVYYRGISTTIPITILGRVPVPPERRILLQRRGWRTGMFGWKTGAVLGGNYGKDIDVTPDRVGLWDEDVLPDQRKKIDRDLEQYMSEKYAPVDQVILETDFIRIPASSGDGYFRLVVCPHKSARSIIAATGAFRLASLSADSAHIRGATLGMLAPELALKHASGTVLSAAEGTLCAASPVVKSVETTPGTKVLGKWALDSGYRRVAGKETRARYNSLDDVYHHFIDEIYDSIPKVNVGVRTRHDLVEDKKIGNVLVDFRRRLKEAQLSDTPSIESFDARIFLEHPISP
ncbi:hypothetical protein JR316_0012635 [Psilocybe cubensis]|uniref:Uncharacterized protein n=2 Tax=Psilocybe cubensis TaxID=181762 RepID=A0A8H8CGA9_PSICU|nr:hypothetical protein JR316_0012635 [Psilocybe cubensis]KAH9475520.1 hypothetical protein JR316_0012635 [Psilocybe cubensis]